MNSKWKKIFVTATVCYTLYNTLPSAFYYFQDLDSPIKSSKTEQILKDWKKDLKIHDREIYEWIRSYSAGLNIEISKIGPYNNSSRAVYVEFKEAKDIDKFENFFSKAISNLPFKTYEMSIGSKTERGLILFRKYPTTQLALDSSMYVPALSKSDSHENIKLYVAARLKSIIDEIVNTDLIASYINQNYPSKSSEPLSKSSLKQVFSMIDSLPIKSEQKKRLFDLSIKNKSSWTKQASDQISFLNEFECSDLFKSSLSENLHNSKSWDRKDNLVQIYNHPLVSSLEISQKHNLIKLNFHNDILNHQTPEIKWMIAELIGQIKRSTGSTFTEDDSGFISNISSNPHSPLLITKLASLAVEEILDIQSLIKALFKADSEDFKSSNYPVVTQGEFFKLSALDQETCLLFHSPLKDEQIFKNANPQSIYVICKNFEKMTKDADKSHDYESKSMQKDIKQLSRLLNSFGFEQKNLHDLGYESKTDAVFELKNAYAGFFEILGENHKIHGSLPYATLELGTLKDRISSKTAKSYKKQESLVAWKDNFYASQDGLKGLEPKTVAKPTKNPLISNLLLKAKSFVSGNDKNTLKFGLDLSGGKNILIQLEDQKGAKISHPDDIKTAISELYARVNRLGVSEVTIRQEGDYISLDFPGSQNLSATELVNASDMYFHVVNEEFSYQNPETAPYVSDFLFQVWNQAIQKGTTDSKDLQKIGYNLLNDKNLQSPSIQKLKEKGLKLAGSSDSISTDKLDLALSKIVKYKSVDSEEVSDCPLLIVFNNYALEGVALKDVQCSYDPTKGNFLSFNIQKKISHKQETILPQEKLAEWTGFFAKNKSKHTFKAPRGWRMAVLLNSEIVSAPVLESALSDSASINGSFSQRDLLKLKADLQAGALSFKPKIILEQNIAPELGAKDRQSGIVSMGISLILVTALMTAYYRFHGIIATCALLLNLSMLFASAVFFNITLSLASIAGIILTLGMAVDANVLIFERMREEKEKGSGLIESVIKGYNKAFTAIVDSNLTTMIAAGVLLGFDSGPIKGFSLTLLIGLVTSVITALFMTKFFYYEWMHKTKSQALNFSKWFSFNNFNFLKYGKVAVAFSFAILALGASAFYIKSSEIIGMDFKGGYSVDLKFDESTTKDQVTQSLEKIGLKSNFIQARELEDKNHIRLVLDPSINSYKNQNQTWSGFFTKIFSEARLPLDANTVKNIDKHVTTVSGQLSDSMKNQALLGLSIALGCIFLYVLIRFKWAYAIAATLSLLHDVILTIACMAILNFFGVPVSLEMSSLAAILTIIGYSLNDTIIVFDRVREELSLDSNSKFHQIISKSLNATLSRTILTSGTTLIVLIPMIFVGHGTLFNFSLVMTLGVVLGTLSTLYIASPLLLFLSKNQRKKVETV